MKKVYVLLVGFNYEGFNGDVRVFASRELAEKAEKEVIEEGDYSMTWIEEVEIEG